MPELSGPLLARCNSCYAETEHERLCHEVRTIQGGASRSAVFRCRGCRTLCIRTEVWSAQSEEGGIPSGEPSEVVYEPPRSWWRPPDWLSDLSEIEPDLQDILREVYSATNDRQFRLLAMGVRTVLDQVMTRIVGDVGGFEAKLDAMVESGHLSQHRREMLGTVIDAGSAAAHRGFKPELALLRHMMSAMEDLICGHYVTRPMLQRLRQHIPPRPTPMPGRKPTE